MSRQRDNLASKCRNNKFYMLSRYTFYTLLYHVVSILIMYTSHNMAIKLLCKFRFLIKLNHIECLEQENIWLFLSSEVLYLRPQRQEYLCKIHNIPSELHDNHTFANLTATSVQKVFLQALFSVQDFHVQKTVVQNTLIINNKWFLGKSRIVKTIARTRKKRSKQEKHDNILFE